MRLGRGVVGEQGNLRPLGGVREARHLCQPLAGNDADIGAGSAGAVGQHVVRAHALVRPKQLAHMVGHVADGGRLEFHHMSIEPGRTTHRLAGVVDDEVQPVVRFVQLMTERLDTGCVAQVEPENFQTMAPLPEVRLGGIPRGRVARKARGNDEMGAGAQQLDAGLIADFYPSAGEQRHATGEVGQFAALGVIEVGARGAELIVKMVQHIERPLAHVAMLRLECLAKIRIVNGDLFVAAGQQVVGRGEHRLATKRTNARAVEL